MKGLDHQFTNIISTLRQKISDLNNPIINHVGYRLFLKNGKTIGFSTNLSWNSFLENYNFTTELSAHYKAELCNIISNNFKYYIRSSKLGVTSPFIKALDKFKLGTSLIIYKKSCNKIEGFYFITSNDTNDVFNFYLNKISVFNYFIDIASPLIGSILEKPLYNNLYSRIFTEKDSLVLFPCRDILIKAKGLSVKTSEHTVKYCMKLTKIHMEEQIECNDNNHHDDCMFCLF